MQIVHVFWIILCGLCALAVLWLVVAKPVTRLCRAMGVRTPCPFWLGWILLLRPGRWRREAIIARSGARPGEAVLELGCGVGVFTPALATAVAPGGSVIAVDVQPRMAAATQRRLERTAAEVGREHLEVAAVQADARALPFAAASFDRVVLISALPEMPEKPRVLAEIARVLRPGGEVAITEEFFDPEYRLPGETRRLLERAGFERLCRAGSWLMYTTRFRPPPEG